MFRLSALLLSSTVFQNRADALLLCVEKKCCNRGACFIGFDLMLVDDGISRVLPLWRVRLTQRVCGIPNVMSAFGDI